MPKKIYRFRAQAHGKHSTSFFPASTVRYFTIPYHTVPYHTIPYHTIPYHTIPYHTIPYHTIPYHTIPYHTIPYHTIPYHTIPYHTIPFPGTFTYLYNLGPRNLNCMRPVVPRGCLGCYTISYYTTLFKKVTSLCLIERACTLLRLAHRAGSCSILHLGGSPDIVHIYSSWLSSGWLSGL